MRSRAEHVLDEEIHEEYRHEEYDGLCKCSVGENPM